MLPVLQSGVAPILIEGKGGEGIEIARVRRKVVRVGALLAVGRCLLAGVVLVCLGETGSVSAKVIHRAARQVDIVGGSKFLLVRLGRYFNVDADVNFLGRNFPALDWLKLMKSRSLSRESCLKPSVRFRREVDCTNFFAPPTQYR